MDISPIDSLTGLVETLGKYRADRIRYHQQGTGKKQPAAANIANTVHLQMQKFDNAFEHPINDVLYGMVNCFEDERKRLSVQRLFNVFQCIPIINTREIQRMMNIDQRQAQRYMKCAKLTLPFLERALKKKEAPDDIRHT